MGGLFGGGGSAPSGPSQAELDAQAERERRASEKENEEKRKIASRNIARTRGRGPNRQLMTALAGTRELPKTTLGPQRNTRT